MAWLIAKKQLLSNLLTLRFAVGTTLFLILTVLFSCVLVGEYGQKLEDYNALISENKDDLKKVMTYQNLKPTVYKPPEILSVFNKGIDENMGQEANISVGEIPELKSVAASKNPLLSVFPLLDVVLIFKLVVSILAILLAYDAISGEKENGTLRLILSNSVPRYQVILGKFTSSMITLIIPITAGFLMISLILEVSPIVDLTASEWSRIALMFIVSLIMVSTLSNLALLLSCITKRSSDALMFLLFLWVLFLVVIPNGSAYLVSQIKPIEPQDEVDLQVKDIWNRYQEKASNFRTRNPINGIAIRSDAQEPGGWYSWFATKNLIRSRQKLNAYTVPLEIECANESWQVARSYVENMKRRKELTDMISSVSPISLYENLVSSLSRTDAPSFAWFAIQTREYRQEIINYLRDRNAFSSIRYFATIEEEYLVDVESEEEYEVLRREYSRKRKAQPLDISALPLFDYRPEATTVTLKRILPNAGLLCFMTLFFFMCAFTAFLRYDVR